LNAMLTSAGALAGKAIFKKVVLDLYQALVQQTGRKIKQWNTDQQIDKLYQQIGQVRKVKTIWQIDKAVDLIDFYCDSHVILDEKRCKVSKLSDFKTKANILIQGIAGQGKSILLRYLCSVELGRGEYIPIFLELRRVSQSETLKDRIFTAFESLKLSIDDEIFAALGASGKIVLLLDAFDEVPDDLKSSVLTEIEDLIATKPNIRVIVTSRPHQDIRFSNFFNVVVLDNLKGDEYKNVIKKLAQSPAFADTLIEHINNQARHIVDLLCTPLMVTLLVLSYKSYNQLPAKLSDFYDSLFQALLQRHDGTKPGFTRKRSCALDDSQYRQVFESLCILAKKTGQQSFDGEKIYSLSQQALEQCVLNANPSSYIDDIVQITCLLVRDGEEYRFIHKTVQEYYTASYIRKKSEAWAYKFYMRVQKNSFFQVWQQELAFLSEIDSYRYNKFFLLPMIINLLGIQESDLEYHNNEAELLSASNLFYKIFFEVKWDENNEVGKLNSVNWGHDNFLSVQIYNDNIHKFWAALNMSITRAKSKLRELKEYIYLVREENCSRYCIADLVKMPIDLAHNNYVPFFRVYEWLRFTENGVCLSFKKPLPLRRHVRSTSRK
jgi:hypothetical protein